MCERWHWCWTDGKRCYLYSQCPSSHRACARRKCCSGCIRTAQSCNFVAHRDTCTSWYFCGCMIAVLIVSENICKYCFAIRIRALITQNASWGLRIESARNVCTHLERQRRIDYRCFKTHAQKPWRRFNITFVIHFHDSQDLHFGSSITRSIIQFARISNQLSLLKHFFDRSNGPVRSSEVFEFWRVRSEPWSVANNANSKDSKDSTVKLIVILIATICSDESDDACRFFLSIPLNTIDSFWLPYLEFNFDRCSLVGRWAWISSLN